MLEALGIIVNAITNIFANLFSAFTILKESIGLVVGVHTYFPTILSISFWIFLAIMIFNYILGR